MIIQRDNDKVQEMQREREIQNELRARVNEYLRNHPTRKTSASPRERGRGKEQTYMNKLQSNHTIPRVHPTALSD